MLIGDRCTFEEECFASIVNSNCSLSTNTCFCEEGFMSDYNETECVLRKREGEGDVEDEGEGDREGVGEVREKGRWRVRA